MNMDGNTFIALLQSPESGSADHAELSQSNDRGSSETGPGVERPQATLKTLKTAESQNDRATEAIAPEAPGTWHISKSESIVSNRYGLFRSIEGSNPSPSAHDGKALQTTGKALHRSFMVQAVKAFARTEAQEWANARAVAPRAARAPIARQGPEDATSSHTLELSGPRRSPQRLLNRPTR